MPVIRCPGCLGGCSSPASVAFVWLDLPAPIAIWRVVRRTWQRARSQEELWNGNTEPGMWHALTSEEGIIRWALRTRRRVRRNALAVEGAHPYMQVVRLRTQREADDWVSRLP